MITTKLSYKMRSKYVKLSKNSYVRIYDDGKLGYITNQRTEIDRVYNSIGADFLSVLKREPRKIDDLIDELSALYIDVERQVIGNDFITFINDLVDYHFLLIANSLEEINAINENYINESFDELTNADTSNISEEYTSRYFWFKHDAQKPCLRTLHIELSSKCNERCTHCFIPNSVKDTGSNMKLEMFKSLIDQFCEMGGLSVTLSGGEPLLNKNISEMLYYCREKDLCISLFSNLIALDDKLISVLKDVNVANVQVSLYSTDSLLHDNVTQVKGSYEKTISAIEKLRKNGIPISLSCPLMKTNKGTMGKMIKYAQSNDIPIKIDYMIIAQSNFGKENLNARLSLEETEQVINDMINNDTKGAQFGDNTTSLKNRNGIADFPICSAATHTLCISSNGSVSPCVNLSGMIAGNLNNNTLQEIWNNSETLKSIRNVRQKDFSKCFMCEAKQYCRMCMGQNYNESGGDIFYINEQFCEVAFLTKRLIEKNNIYQNS